MNRSFVSRSFVLLTLLAAAGTPSARAQAAAATVASTPILEHRFAGGADSAAVVLDQRFTYRAETVGAARGALEVRPSGGHAQPAFLSPLPDAEPGRTRYELYPMQSGTHWVRLAAPAAASRSADTVADSVVVRIFADPRATAESRARALDRRASRWTIGLAVAGGAHSSFALGATTTAAGGADLEGGLTAGSFANPVSVYLGMAVQPATERGVQVTWYFIEPRVRLLRRGPLDLSALVRVAQGSAYRGTVDPVLLAGGAVLTERFAADAAGRGLALQLGYAYGGISNNAAQGETMHRGSLGLVWTP